MYTYTEKNFSSKKYPYTSAMDSTIEEYIDHELTLIQHHLLPKESQISELKTRAASIKSYYQNIIIIGMGGSITSIKTLLELGKSKRACSTKIFCVDSTDVTQIKGIRDVIDLHSSKFLVISKSGNTLETISIFSAFFHMYKIGKVPTPGKHFCFITSLQDNQLIKIAYNNNIQVLPHDNTISGRFSSFRNITLLPASIADLDILKFYQGGKSILQDCLARKILSPPSKGSTNAVPFQ